MKVKLTVILLSISFIVFSMGLFYYIHPVTPAITTATQPIQSQLPPNIIIKDFFNQYYHAYETHQLPDFTSFIETNNKTLLFIEQLKYRLAIFDTFNDLYENISVKLTYYNTTFVPTEFTTSIYVSASYHYKRDPANIFSHEGTFIHLTLKPYNHCWVITSISPEDIEYTMLQSAITDTVHPLDRDTTDYTNAIHYYIDNRVSLLSTQRHQWNDFVTTYSSLSLRNPQLTQSIHTHNLLVSYSGDDAANYGETFGNVFQNGIFKRMEADCTNFVSQCLWAGYGGTNGLSLSNTNPLKARVKQNYRMVDSHGTLNDWWGLNADSSLSYPSSTFMRVTELYHFCTTNQTLGPQAFGYNNNQYYWQLEGTTIHRGDVLQFYSYTKHRYSHSVIVVSPETESYDGNSPWNIRVAQHTGDYSRRPLHQIITVFSDTTTDGQTRDCKMRLLKPIPGSFKE